MADKITIIHKSNFRYRLFILVSSILSTLISVVFTKNSNFIYLFVIPFSYGILTWFLAKSIKDIGPGLLMMFIALFVRYIVFVPIFIISGYNTYIYNNYPVNLFGESMLLMIYEMIVIMVSVYLYDLYFKKKEFIKNRFRKNELVFLYSIPNSFGIILMVIISLIFIYKEPALLNNYSFFLSPSEIKIIDVDIISGSKVGDSIIWWTKLLVTIYLFSYFYKKYILSNKEIYFILSIIFLILPSLFFDQRSRMSMLLPLVSSLFLLRIVYKKRKKIITSFFLIMITINMSILTAYKNFGGSTVSTAVDVLGFDQLSDLLNMYFAGVPNITAGINAKMVFGSHLSLNTFLNDLFGYTMGLAKNFDGYNSTKLYGDFLYGYGFNNGFYDQILPTIIHGYFYFGFLLSPIFTIIMIFSFMYFDHVTKTTKRLDYAFIFAMVSAIVGFAIPAGFYHLTINVMNILVPVLIFMYLNGKKIIQN